MSSVVSVGFVMDRHLAPLWCDGAVLERAPCGVCTYRMFLYAVRFLG